MKISVKIFTIVLCSMVFFSYTEKSYADVFTIRRDGNLCRDFSFNENINAVKTGQIGPGCTFTVDTTATGEWVFTGASFDSPPYAWGSDVYYSNAGNNHDSGQYSYTCTLPNYTLDTSILPSYISLANTQIINSSDPSTAPGRRYTFKVSQAAPPTGSFSLVSSFTSTCNMKYNGSILDAVTTDGIHCDQGTVKNINPRKSTLSVPIAFNSTCVVATPTLTPTPTQVQCNANCSNPNQCPMNCSQCVSNGSGGSVCKAGCGQSCTSGSMCPLSCPICSINGTCQPQPTATPTPLPQCGSTCNPSNNLCPDACPICFGTGGASYICVGPTSTPTPTPTPTKVPCNSACTNANQCDLSCSQCVPGSSGGPSVCKAGCGGSCTNASQCPINCSICTVNGTCAAPTLTPTPTGIPCNQACSNSTQCGIQCSQCVPGSLGGPSVCKAGCGGSCTNASQCPINCSICTVNGTCEPPPPTPTFVPCNSSCSDPTQCALQCNQCVPGSSGGSVCKAGCGGSCTNASQCPLNCSICTANGLCAAPSPTPTTTPTQTPSPTPTPTPVPCNGSCTDPTQCALQCNQCVLGSSGGSVCKAGCGTSCTDASQCPQNCSQCAPSVSGQGTVCRNQASCNCDGIDFEGEVAPGQTIRSTGFAKVETPDINDAKVLNMVFHVERDGTEIAVSDPIPASTANRTTDVNGTPVDRYSSSWNYQIPSEGSGTMNYRVYVKISCGYKNVNYASLPKKQLASGRRLFGRSVLGTATTDTGIIGSVINFIQNMLGITSDTPTPTPTIAAPTLTPQQASQYIFEALDSPTWYAFARPTSTKFDSLKLGTFDPNRTPTPTPVVERLCKQFSFSLNY